jgi:hypothetical protein
VKPLKLTWKDRVRSWIGVKLFKIIGIKSGPAMISARGEWYYIDFDGTIYRIRPTGTYDGSPLIIEVIRK